jgi:hypothetical protein
MKGRGKKGKGKGKVERGKGKGREGREGLTLSSLF